MEIANQMNPSVTYLLGAGASFNTMPLITDFYKYFENSESEMWSWMAQTYGLREDSNSANGLRFENGSEYADEALATYFEIKELNERGRQHFSIDTLIKKYWFQNNPEKVRRLKNILNVILTQFQATHFIDKRYEAFLASIIEKDLQTKKLHLPSNLNIYSWNYDLLLEQALNRINRDLYFDLFNNFLRNKEHFVLDSGFFYHKLNGYAGWPFLTKDGILDMDYLEDEFKKEYYKPDYGQTMKLLKLSEDIDSHISFAWEKKREDLIKLFNYSNQSLDEKVLVVIGYSFPSFNSRVDSLFLENHRFSKIYVQCDKRGHEVAQRINAIKGSGTSKENVIVLDGVDEFYIPKEVEFTYSGKISF